MATANKPPFAARLRELRERAGLTQAQLADRAGLHLSAVTRFEQGLREPALGTAANLAAALGVTVDDLLKPPERESGSVPRGRPKKGLEPAAEKPKRPRGRPLKEG
jgi:transcriptional regulator with XRE-family HTH domain